MELIICTTTPLKFQQQTPLVSPGEIGRTETNPNQKERI